MLRFEHFNSTAKSPTCRTSTTAFLPSPKTEKPALTKLHRWNPISAGRVLVPLRKYQIIKTVLLLSAKTVRTLTPDGGHSMLWDAFRGLLTNGYFTLVCYLCENCLTRVSCTAMSL